MDKISIYTDGSCLGNPGAGGWAYILKYKEHIKEEAGGEENTTNNRMELLSVIKAISALKRPCDIELYSDSNYVVRGINEWLDGWKLNNFKKVKNPDLWREYLVISKEHKVKAYWIKGHSGHSENERCDEMARSQAELIRDRTSLPL